MMLHGVFIKSLTSPADQHVLQCSGQRKWFDRVPFPLCGAVSGGSLILDRCVAAAPIWLSCSVAADQSAIMCAGLTLYLPGFDKLKTTHLHCQEPSLR